MAKPFFLKLIGYASLQPCLNVTLLSLALLTRRSLFILSLIGTEHLHEEFLFYYSEINVSYSLRSPWFQQFVVISTIDH